MTPAIAIPHHSGSLLMCMQFEVIGIATEVPLVAIPQQTRCKREHVA
jgi:hypothetical protein